MTTNRVNNILNLMSISKPQKMFMMALFDVLVVFRGRATFRNMSRYSTMSEKCFSRWYRRAFDFAQFNTLLLQQSLPKSSDCIAVMDASFMKKSGSKTDGLAQFYNGSQGKAEKGLEVSLIAITDLRANTAYALDARQTVDADKIEKEDGEEEETRVDLYARHFSDIAPKLFSLNIYYAAFDAYYAKVKFVDAVVLTGIHMIGKLRMDANLNWLYTGEYSGRGRPKKYDGKVDIDTELNRFDFIDTLDNGTDVHTAKLYSKSLKREIRVILLKTEKAGKTGMAILFSTDVNLDAMTLLSYYKARFQIEFVFRDAKQHTGLVDCQSLDRKKIKTQVNAALTTLNLLKIEDRQSKKTDDETVISIRSWKRLRANQHLMCRLFGMLRLSMSDQKVVRAYQELSHYDAVAA